MGLVNERDRGGGINMATLITLSPQESQHWLLHLDACIADTPEVKREAKVFINGGELPPIAHPFYIHDWLEKPKRRLEIETWLIS